MKHAWAACDAIPFCLACEGPARTGSSLRVCTPMVSVECPAYTRIAEDIELGKSLMKLLPPSESVSRQFLTACNTLNLQRQEVRRSLERGWDQQVHRAATQDALVKYYAHLTTPPLCNVDLSMLRVRFKWKDGIGYSKAVKDASGDLEKNNLAYNIGVSCSYLATEVLKQTDNASRFVTAKRHFEEAAGAFWHVRQRVMQDAATGGVRADKMNLELRIESLDALVSVMLSYALRCVYDKAKADNSPPKILARLAHKVRIPALTTSLRGVRLLHPTMHRPAACKRLSGSNMAWKRCSPTGSRFIPLSCILRQSLRSLLQYLELEYEFYLAQVVGSTANFLHDRDLLQARLHSADVDDPMVFPAKVLIFTGSAIPALLLLISTSSSSSKLAGAAKIFKKHRPDFLKEKTSVEGMQWQICEGREYAAMTTTVIVTAVVQEDTTPLSETFEE
eukprot:760921-Hanusia_phi.AAC.1